MGTSVITCVLLWAVWW